MSIVEDLPFYLIVISNLVNIVLGLIYKAGFVDLMIRSIVITLISVLIGYIICIIGRQLNNTNKNIHKKSNTIDYSVPPSDDEMPKYDENFKEVNPADLHDKDYFTDS